MLSLLTRILVCILHRGRGYLKRISPTGDLAFKKVLSSEENKDILGGLIKDFFEVDAEELTLENPYNIAAYKEILTAGEEVTVLRNTLKDVAATFRVADFVSEIQIKKTLYFDERSLYYPLVRYTQNYSKEGFMKARADGKPSRYSSLRPIYALNILGYSHFDENGDEDALRIFELYDPERHKRFNKRLLRIGYFKLTKPHIETDNQRYWRDYFTTGEVSAGAPEYIKKASSIIEFLNLTEEERNVVQILDKAQAIMDSELVSSYFEGLEEGEARGEARGEANAKIMNAKSMIKDGVPLEKVAIYSGLPLDFIKTLL